MISLRNSSDVLQIPSCSLPWQRVLLDIDTARPTGFVLSDKLLLPFDSLLFYYLNIPNTTLDSSHTGQTPPVLSRVNSGLLERASVQPLTSDTTRALNC